MPELDPPSYFSVIGKKGGSAARGDKKRRSPEFYRKLSRKGVLARKRKAREASQNGA